MPIYEYRCITCDAEFEKLMKIDAPLPQCSSCGSAEVKKKVSASGFVLKGSGWYRDHYGLKSSSSESGSSKAGESSASEKSTSSTTSKTSSSE